MKLKNIYYLLFIVYIFFLIPSESISFDSSAIKNGAEIYNLTYQIQAQIATEVIYNDKFEIRSSAILDICKETSSANKKNIPDYIIRRILEIRDGNDKKAKFLKERTKNEIIIISSGILENISIYQLGFKDSNEINFSLNIADRGKYCELIEKKLMIQ